LTTIGGILRTSAAGILMAFVCAGAFAQCCQSDLGLDKTEDGAIAAGKATTYTLLAHAGDFLNLRLDPFDVEITVVALKPNGEKERATKIGPEADTFAFIAQADGRYRLELSIEDKTKSATFTLTLKKSISLAERLAVPKAKNESPRMNALRAAIESGNSSAIPAFWHEIQKSGTPLIERPPADDDKEQKEMLVTFLWKGTAATKNVLIVWFPFMMQSPADYRLEQIPNSDIWYRTLKVDARKRFIYRLAPNAPNFHAADDEEGLFPKIWAGSQLDPLNPNHWAADPSDPDVPEHQGFSAVDMPKAPAQPWGAPRKGVAEGKIERHQFASAILKNEREVAVYLPPKFPKANENEYPMLLVFDENAYLKNEKETARVPTETILDNLIAEKRIPPMVAVFVDNGPGNARSRELPCNNQFADFLNFELMPWVRRLYHVTSDPREIVVAGSSYGGLASTWVAFRHPETFGNVLSQSGSYWWTPPKANDEFDREAEPSWVAKQFIASPKLPIRFYMDAGSDEIDLSGKGNSILIPNRHLRDVLLAKGYEVHYQEFNGGHDYLSWRGTIADGLILLMGGAADNAAASEPHPRDVAHP
jgi:enterochelin esterase-like enzyme